MDRTSGRRPALEPLGSSHGIGLFETHVLGPSDADDLYPCSNLHDVRQRLLAIEEWHCSEL